MAQTEEACLPEAGAAENARRVLAQRIAHRNRLRAERLARLHRAGQGEEIPVPSAPPSATPSVARAAPRAPEPVAEIIPPEDTGATAGAAPAPEPVTVAPPEDGAAALEDFLRAIGDSAGQMPAEVPVQTPAAEAAAVLKFERPPPAADVAETPEAVPAFPAGEPVAAPVCDLGCLEGVGPGLVWAFGRAGIDCMADLAAVEAGELSGRLGPVARLLPLERWIARARQA